MIIQRLLAPSGNCSKLYLRELDRKRREKEVTIDRSGIVWPLNLRRGDVWSLDTYVNALSIEKWVECSSIDSIEIVIRATKRLRIEVYNSISICDDDALTRHAARHIVPADIFGEEGEDYIEYIVTLTDINYQGVIYPVIEALEDDCKFLGGEYTCAASIGVSEERNVRPICILNYNKDAEIIKKNIDVISASECGDIPIMINDMTGRSSKEALLDENRYKHVVEVVPSSECLGDGINRIYKLIGEDYPIYTHAIIIDRGAVIVPGAIERLYTFLTLLDDARSDMIVQGDVLREDKYIEACGYEVTSDSVIERFAGFDMTRREDYAALESVGELDFFRIGVLCMPLGAYTKQRDDSVIDDPFDSSLHSSIELDYYLRHKPLALIGLNGLYASRSTGSEEGIVRTYYYRFRDECIARVDSDMETGKEAFRVRLDTEYKRQLKRGNLELAAAIIDAASDFMAGPIIYDRTDKIHSRLNELTKKLDDSIIRRRNKLRDKVKLELEYNRLCVIIDRDYDMITDTWRRKREVSDEREQ